MNTKELVLAVAKQTNLPADEVDKVSRALFEKFAELIETRGRFQSPHLQVIGTVSPAKPATEGTPAIPERKFARLRVPPRKPKG
jgi:hypothetical protein